MPGIAADLSHTTDRWARCLGPVVEEVAQTLYRAATQPPTRRRWTSRRRSTENVLTQAPPLPTPLTETHRRKARHELHGSPQPTGKPEAGESYSDTRTVFWENAPPTQPPESRRSLTDRDVEESARQLLTAVLVGVEPLSRPVFLRAIMPALRGIPAEKIAREVGLSVPYCAKIRAGRCVPREDHWNAFRRLLSQNYNRGST